MTAKEWIFEKCPQVKDEWNKTGHDDNYMVRMMEEYHKAKLKLLGIADVSDLCCASCGYQMKFDSNEDKWGCTKCGHTSQHYR